MKISELVAQLEALKAVHGDAEVGYFDGAQGGATFCVSGAQYVTLSGNENRVTGIGCDREPPLVTAYVFLNGGEMIHS